MKRKFFQTVCLSTLIMLVLTISGKSQWYYSVSTDQEYNSNPFRLPNGTSDYISQFALELQHDWSNFSVQYTGSYLNFQDNASHNYYWQQLSLGGGDTTRWYLQAENRLNRSDFSYYDYLQFAGGFNHRNFRNNTLLQMGANFYLNTYPELSELNNFQFNGYLTYHHSFPTRTTFIGAVNYNFKAYLNPYEYVEEAATDEGIVTSISSVDGYGGGRGRRDTSGMGGVTTSWYYGNQFLETTTVSQMVLTARLAQSLTRFTGVALQYTFRKSLSNQDRSLAGLVPGYQDESRLFDDPMGYEGQTVGVELTKIFPYFVSLKMAGYWKEKNYLSQGIYLDEENFDENTLRQDEYKTIWVSLRKKWALSQNFALTVSAYYQWTDNTSNSYWYQYQNQSVSLGLQLDF